MRRRMSDLVTALSLLLCIAACVLWVRSYSRWDRVGYVRPVATDRLWRIDVHPLVGLFSCNLDFRRVDGGRAHNPPEPIGWYAESRRPTPAETSSHVLATAYYRMLDFSVKHETSSFVAGDGRTTWVDRRSLVLPYWACAFAFGIPPTLRLRRLIERGRRRRNGACLTCGYDLRASPTRCSECGTVVR